MLSSLCIIAAILLPVFASNWGLFAGMVLGSALLLILGFNLCIGVSESAQDPWQALGCLITSLAGGVVSLASMGLGAYRIAGRARGWHSARFPQVLLPGLAFYFGAGVVMWLLVMFLSY
ncbi:MAG: hypothetical protein AAGC81_20115 [Pseudomonadota bacterium]